MDDKTFWKASGGAIEAQCWEPWCYVAFWGLLGVVFGPLWIPFRALLGFSWVVLGPFWAVLVRLGGLWPSWGSPGGVLGPSGVPLWALLGLPWARLGALLSCLGTFLD
eukprot:7678769-Pyramimonas_sp.AAC.1